MDFWMFSLALYAEPDVAPCCIALQDGCGADVNLVLFALWAARRGARLTRADLAGVEAAVRAWRTGVVQPLRSARRALKPAPTGFDPAAGALRDLVKAAELESERQQQARMGPLLPPATEAPSAALARANLDAYAQAISVRFPEADIAVLLAAWKRTDAIRTGPASRG